jgi:hypothetical protein
MLIIVGLGPPQRFLPSRRARERGGNFAGPMLDVALLVFRVPKVADGDSRNGILLFLDRIIWTGHTVFQSHGVRCQICKQMKLTATATTTRFLFICLFIPILPNVPQ